MFKKFQWYLLNAKSWKLTHRAETIWVCWIAVYLHGLLEKAMAPHSSTLAWKIPWIEEPGRLSPWGLWGSDTTEWLHFHLSLSCIGEGNGNPLQCSCLENPRDRGAWWAAVYGVAQSRTWLKWLSSSSTWFVLKYNHGFLFPFNLSGFFFSFFI